MGVDEWFETYSDHPAWQIIDTTIELIDETEPPSEPYKGQLAFVRLILATVSHWRETPSPLVSSQMLADLHTAVRNNVKRELDHWKSNNNPNHISNAHTNLSTVMDAVRGWPPTKERTIRSAAAALRESAKASDIHLEKLKTRAEGVESELHRVALDVEQRFDQREDKSIERFRELEQRLSTVNTKLEQIDGRVDTLITQQQERFEAAAESRAEKHQETLESQDEQFEKALDESLEKSHTLLGSQEDQGKEVLARLAQLKQDAEDVVGALGTASTANWYQTHAEEQRQSADSWRKVAVALFGSAFVVVAISVFMFGTSDDTWKSTVLKATATATLVAGAAYAAKESGGHREKEFEAKKTELTLRALDPFIATLEEPERRQLKMDTTRHVFISDGKVDSILSPSDTDEDLGEADPE